MTNIPKLHCHSSFAHYDMFHCNRSSSYGNSVFNTTYNFNGGTICGGGFWGGFLGGIGMGLGAGIMNFLTGGMGMFGGGMGMFGGGFPMMNMFGGNMYAGGIWNWGGTHKGDGAGGKNRTDEKSDCGGKDAEYLHTLRERLNKIKNASDPGKAAKDLYNDIVAVIAKQKDDAHNDIDDKNYKDLKADLEKEWKFELDKDGKATKADKVNAQPAAQTHEQSATNTQQTPAITDNGSSSGVHPTVNTDNQAGAVKFTLHFAKHDRANMIDTTIKGDVIGLKTNSKNEIESYVIKCKAGEDGNTLGLIFLVTPNDPKNPTSYNIKCISTTHKATNSKGQKYTLYKKDDGVNYTYDQDKQMLVTDSNDTTVSTSNKTGYSPITFDNNSDETFESLKSSVRGLEDFDNINEYELTSNEHGVTAQKKDKED